MLSKRKWLSSVALDQRISHVEQRLQQRRYFSVLHFARLRRSLRNKLSSPITLLVAFGVGFAAERFRLIGKVKSIAIAAVSDNGHATTLGMLMNAFGLASFLMTTLQATPARHSPMAAAAVEKNDR